MGNYAIGSHVLRGLRRPGSSGSICMLADKENSMDELTERIVELEIRYTHQNHLIEELNSELTASNRRIDRLEREVSALREMLGSMGPELTQSPDE